ncbi:FecR family protein [Solilutibacter pythonis]|uniref:FecR family protein n=1 Tax=Solilutibacter pythonis TaxID=2483112 RepID=UPI001314DAC6|nr:FecR domain-containing protein [Lysobacter pythonis]
MKIYRASQREERERIARQAAEWLYVMKGDPGDEDREAFGAWIVASQVHLREFLIADMLERELSVGGLDGFDVDAVVAAARARDGGNVVRLDVAPIAPRPVAAHPRSPWWRRLGPRRLAAAAAAFVLVGLLVWRGGPVERPVAVEYSTSIGQKRTLALSDGSRIVLSPRSGIEVAFSGEARDIRLRYGEADFEVARDAARPFRVHAGESLIQAIGTRFSVNRLPSGTRVSVSHGVVKVSKQQTLPLGAERWLAALGERRAPKDSLRAPVRLSSGEAVRISGDGRTLARADAATEEVVSEAPATNARRLVFRDASLADIAEEFNRYNRQQIEVEGESAARQRYSGVFDATDPESFLQFVACCSSLKVTEAGGHTLIQERD